MKNVVVFFEKPGTWGYPFNKSEYFNSHCQLNAEIEALGGNYIITRGQDSYEGGGRFSQSWRIRGRDVIESGPVDSDVIYDKGDIKPNGFDPIFNCPAVTKLCRDKWESHQLLEDLSPTTFLVHTEDELRDALSKLEGRLKVVKPVFGYEGKGVHIAADADLLAAPITYPVLVQQFLDTSVGVPGIVDGAHDFRVTLLNGEVLLGFVRTPPEGGLLAGVAFGGDLFVVPIERIPQIFLDTAIEADRRMAKHGPRFLTVDMARSPQGVKIIEVNSRVGLQENARHPVFRNLKKKLAEALMAL